MDQLLLKMATMEVQDLGYWKRMHFKNVATRDINKWKSHLGLISRHTGLPSQTERDLRYETDGRKAPFENHLDEAPEVYDVFNVPGA